MFFNEPQIVLENLKPPFLLPQGIVGLAVLHKPRLIHVPRVALVVVDDGHVHGPASTERQKEKRKRKQKCMGKET